MKTLTLLNLLFASQFIFSCSTGLIKTADRPELKKDEQIERVSYRADEVDSNTKPINDEIKSVRMSSADIDKIAYELGYNPKKELTSSQIDEIKTRFKLRQLERTLDSEKERYNYSRVLPLFKNDQEKIEYLSIKSIEGRQLWVNRNKLWNRDNSAEKFKSVVEARDIAIGMTQDLVISSWGEPAAIEHSGNPIYKNERWKYIRELPSVNGFKQQRRIVYFEGGRVVGWETQ